MLAYSIDLCYNIKKFNRNVMKEGLSQALIYLSDELESPDDVDFTLRFIEAFSQSKFTNTSKINLFLDRIDEYKDKNPEIRIALARAATVLSCLHEECGLTSKDRKKMTYLQAKTIFFSHSSSFFFKQRNIGKKGVSALLIFFNNNG